IPTAAPGDRILRSGYRAVHGPPDHWAAPWGNLGGKPGRTGRYISVYAVFARAVNGRRPRALGTELRVWRRVPPSGDAGGVAVGAVDRPPDRSHAGLPVGEIGRASCRERGEISVVG